MPSVFLAPSTQEYNPYIIGGNEELYMNQIADAMIPYLQASGIQYGRNNRNQDVTQSVAKANSGNYDLYLSLHSNASAPTFEGMLQGPDVLYYPSSVNGKRAAEIIANNLKEIYPIPELSNIIPSPGYIELRTTKAPAVIVEIAYHDNKDDATWIANNIDAIAENLAMSLADYFVIPFVDPKEIQFGIVDINSGSLNMRNAPSVNSQIIGSIPDDTTIPIFSKVGDWYSTRYNGRNGYVNSNYIILQS